MGSIVFFIGQSANNAISDTVRRDANLLKARGTDVTIVDLTQPIELPDPDHVDMIVSYQAWGHDLVIGDGKKYADLANCPFIVVLGDHPIHHATRVLACPENTTFCVGSQNQVAFLKNVLNVKGGTEILPAAIFAERRHATGPRDIATLVVGNAEDPAAFLASQNLPAQITDIIWHFANRTLKEPGLDPINAYLQTGFQEVLNLVGNQASALSVGRLVDLVSRRLFRWRYFQVLRKLPVTFLGDDWSKLQREADDRFATLPSMPFSALPEIYARADLCLNLHPPYYDFHERIIDAMTHGTAVATPWTPLLGERFSFGENILELPLAVEELPTWLEAQHADPARLRAISEAGCRTVERDYGEDRPANLFQTLCLQKAA